MRRHREEAREATQQVTALKRNIGESEEAIKRLGEQEFKDFDGVRTKHKMCSGQERREIEAVEQGLGQELAQLDSRQHQIHQSENTELANALQRVQQEFLEGQLKMHSLYSASIEGIGEKLKCRLRMSGINNAADVTSRMRHVDGIGDVKRQSLLNWRQRLETQIRSRMPQMLPTSTAAAVRSQYAQKRNAIEIEKNTARNNAWQKRETITAKFRQEKQQLDNQSQEIRRASQQKRTELNQGKREQADLLKQWEKYQFEANRKVDVYRNIRFSECLKAILFIKN